MIQYVFYEKAVSVFQRKKAHMGFESFGKIFERKPDHVEETDLGNGEIRKSEYNEKGQIVKDEIYKNGVLKERTTVDEKTGQSTTERFDEEGNPVENK